MRLSFKQLKKLAVVTVSGTVLGKVHDLVFDVEGQMILQFQVSSGLMSGHEYLINREQVRGFNQKQMVVDDNVQAVQTPSPTKVVKTSSPQPAVSMINDVT